MSNALKEDVSLTRALIYARQALVGDSLFVKRIDEQLIEAFGFNLPWQFYHAQSHNTPHKDKVKWAGVARDILVDHINDQFEEILSNEENVF